MLAGLNKAVSGPKEPPRPSRVTADNWRGLYGSDLFSSMLRVTVFRLRPDRTFDVNITIFAGFRLQAGGSLIQAVYR